MAKEEGNGVGDQRGGATHFSTCSATASIAFNSSPELASKTRTYGKRPVNHTPVVDMKARTLLLISSKPKPSESIVEISSSGEVFNPFALAS